MNNFAAIGGVFINSHSPHELSQWYAEYFGMTFESYGESNFHLAVPYKEMDGTICSMVFAIMPLKDRTWGESLTVNLRFKDLKAITDKLVKDGFAVEGPKEYPGEGLFAWVKDPDGNRVELWQDGFDYEAFMAGKP
jgi:predicted enzyme related to lactoylglutathione lyase